MGLMILTFGTISHAQTNLVTPAQYLQMQPKPNFAAGYNLPHLTRWGWTLSTNTDIQLATNWGYDLEFGGYASPSQVTNIFTPGSYDSVVTYLASNQPSLFKLSVIIDRTFPTPIPNGFYDTNSSGQILTNGEGGNAVSPEGPDSYWTNATAYWMQSLRVIQSNAPISIVLNGGEYGLDVPGFGEVAWKQDPRVQAQAVMTNAWATTNLTGTSWPRYTSDRKAHQLGFLTSAIEQQIPNRELYIFYDTGNEQNRYTALANWFDFYDNWGWWSSVMVTNTDLPSLEDYWSLGYNGWGSITNPLPNDILSRHLNAVGYNIELGHPLSYNWVNGGSGGAGGDTNNLSDIPSYTGFLKCLYTAGMVGGVAGYFTYPSGTNGTLIGGPGFDASFPSNSPPDWLQQMMALSHVHALFSHLDNFLYNGTLLPGVTLNIMSTDQPAFEFTNTAGRVNDRVLARKLLDQNHWIVTAWAADGVTNTVTVNIPTIGNLTVTAVPSASVYEVTMAGTNIQRILLDEYSSYPLPPPNNFRPVTP